MAVWRSKSDLVSVNRRVAGGLVNNDIHNFVERAQNEHVKLSLRKLAKVPCDAEKYRRRSFWDLVRAWSFGEIACARQQRIRQSILVPLPRA